MLLKRNGAGRMLRTSGGKLALSCDAVEECIGCDTTPGALSVTIAGVTMCSGHFDINGTWVLMQSGDSCVYELAGDYDEGTPNMSAVVLPISPGLVRWELLAQNSTAFFPATWHDAYDWSPAQETASCMSNFGPVSNVITSCVAGIGGYGGTASVVPL